MWDECGLVYDADTQISRQTLHTKTGNPNSEYSLQNPNQEPGSTPKVIDRSPDPTNKAISGRNIVWCVPENT